MLTDAQPRKANRSGFLESDRIRILDLPQDGRLPAIAKSIGSAMKSDKRARMFAVPAENFWLSPPSSTKSLPAVSGC